MRHICVGRSRYTNTRISPVGSDFTSIAGSSINASIYVIMCGENDQKKTEQNIKGNVPKDDPPGHPLKPPFMLSYVVRTNQKKREQNIKGNLLANDVFSIMCYHVFSF